VKTDKANVKTIDVPNQVTASSDLAVLNS